MVCVRLFLHWLDFGAAIDNVAILRYIKLIATKSVVLNPLLYQNTNLALRRK